MDATPCFEALVRSAGEPAGVAELAGALGFVPAREALPAGAYGLDGAVEQAVAVGRSGTLVALRLELAGDVDADRLVRRVASYNPAVPHLCFLMEGARLTLAAADGAGRVHRLEVDPRRPRRTDIECLEEMAARPGEEGLLLFRRMLRALERSRVTRRFFHDVARQRARIAAGWRGIRRELEEERARLALLFLCRLMFLYFVQRRGLLGGDVTYMRGLVQAYREERADIGTGGRGGSSFYRSRLEPLFFGALNTRPEARSAAAQALGPLPYLNGGLFERHALERRRRLELPDDVVLAVFDDLLERYRFTTREAADADREPTGHPDAGSDAAAIPDGGIDPEMLGRVFEGLMGRERRGRTGSFYTPPRVVTRMVRDALATYMAGEDGVSREAGRALADGRGEVVPDDVRRRVLSRLDGVRVLDPACGSGAFLLDALARLARVRCALGGEPVAVVRRELVAASLYGVDLLDDAALLCALRLWLALTPEPGEAVEPLPNLDRRIRQGDALVDPLDLGYAHGADLGAAARDAAVRRALRRLEPAARAYVSAGPETRPRLQATLHDEERDLARAWLGALDRRLRRALAEAERRAQDRDLFGELSPDAPAARSEAHRVRSRLDELDRARQTLDDDGALPFFSFDVHFADAASRGFDLVLSNPPWVRAHRWPAALRDRAADRFEVCRRAGWRRGAELAGATRAAGGQVDLSLLFMERAVRALAPDGVLAMVLPSKALRSLYGGGARRMLLRDTQVVSIEDHGLDQRAIFRADAFAATLVARKPARPNGPGVVRVTMARRGVAPLRFALPQDRLPAVPGDPAAPWLLAPPDVRVAFRAMQAAGPPLGEALRVRRGVFTGANRVLLFEQAEPKLAGLAAARPEGGEDDVVLEAAALRPCVRGAGIDAWRFQADRLLLWSHGDDGTPTALPPRAAAYVDGHRETLETRSGWRPGMPTGAIFRVRPDCLGPKVAWQDLSDTLRAVALPDLVRGPDGDRPLIPLNTVYFLPVARPDDALVLAALLNATPVRTFARAVAERAKDARFRFFAWTVALVPLPGDWRAGPARRRLLALSRAAHERGGLESGERAELDDVVCRLYGLPPARRAAIEAFDRWLRGEEET